MPASLYVHIPFCLKRCIYCDFVSGIYEPQKADTYIEALKKEILSIVRAKAFLTLYIGGGTPTVLSTGGLTDLITHIFKNLFFVEDYEATIEANPGTIDKEKLQVIHSSGINRISIGIQSFNDDELAFLGRTHSAEDAEQPVYLARDAGFENIGIDLIYGIPGQDLESWKKTLERAVSLKPKHISTYELTVEKGTLLYEYLKANLHATCHPEFISGSKEMLNQSVKQVQDKVQGDNFKVFGTKNKLKLLREEKIIKMYNYAIDYLKSEGYIHYEISNFAMPDYFCRHNLNYWDRGEYYGVGLGAHSFVAGKRFCNTDNFEEYVNLTSANKSPLKETEKITASKALSEAVFLGLRKTEGINLKTFYKSYGKDLLTLYQKEIKQLQEAGLIEICSSDRLSRINRSKENHIRLTRKGLLLSNEIFVKFI